MSTQQQSVKAPSKGEMVPFKAKVDSFRALMEKAKPQIAMAIPKHIKPERLMRIVMTAIQNTPKLADCYQLSLLKCVLQAAALGLEPDGLLGHAYLVPFNNAKERRIDCQLIVGYKGFLKLARQSGEIASIEAHVVRVGDDFKYAFGTDGFLKHKPAEAPLVEIEVEKDRKAMVPDDTWRRGAVTHFYSVVKMKDGTSQFEVMPVWEVLEIRDASQGYQAALKFNSPTPWSTHFAEMGKKTVLRRQMKMIPSSVDRDNMARAVALDEAGDAGLSQDSFIDVSVLDETAQPSASPLDDLAAKAEADAAEPGAQG